ncbi:hypothetical protein [Rhodococcus jostii]|uniref:hypothetical protein n=1 Tax=Rhodococcus jostii TaxID=132919 RepID=UPI00363C65AF
MATTRRPNAVPKIGGLDLTGFLTSIMRLAAHIAHLTDPRNHHTTPPSADPPQNPARSTHHTHQQTTPTTPSPNCTTPQTPHPQH